MSDSEKPNRPLEKEGHQTPKESLSPQALSPLTPAASRGIRSELSCLGLCMNRKSVLLLLLSKYLKSVTLRGCQVISLPKMSTYFIPALSRLPSCKTPVKQVRGQCTSSSNHLIGRSRRNRPEDWVSGALGPKTEKLK